MTKSIEDIIHDAIENHLWGGYDEWRDSPAISAYTCAAVRIAARGNNSLFGKSKSFLEELGWPDYSAFYEFNKGPKRQYARALALTFAELISREEGL